MKNTALQIVNVEKNDAQPPIKLAKKKVVAATFSLPFWSRDEELNKLRNTLHGRLSNPETMISTPNRGLYLQKREIPGLESVQMLTASEGVEGQIDFAKRAPVGLIGLMKEKNKVFISVAEAQDSETDISYQTSQQLLAESFASNKQLGRLARSTEILNQIKATTERNIASRNIAIEQLDQDHYTLHQNEAGANKGLVMIVRQGKVIITAPKVRYRLRKGDTVCVINQNILKLIEGTPTDDQLSRTMAEMIKNGENPDAEVFRLNKILNFVEQAKDGQDWKLEKLSEKIKPLLEIDRQTGTSDPKRRDEENFNMHGHGSLLLLKI